MSIKDLINAYQPETREVTYGEDLKVIFISAPVQVSRDKALELLRLLDGSLKAKTVEVDGQKTIDFDLDFTKILANFSSGTMKNIEQFIIKNSKMYLNVNGEWRQADTAVKAEVDYVFNQHASQYFNFLIDGVKFHFAKHLPSGNGLLANLANKAVNKMQLDEMKPTP
jgi:hypothetical protein